MKKIIIKYLPDIIIIIGVGILSYNIFRGPTENYGINIELVNYHVEEKVLGIILIIIGLDIAVRRYFKK